VFEFKLKKFRWPPNQILASWSQNKTFCARMPKETRCPSAMHKNGKNTKHNRLPSDHCITYVTAVSSSDKPFVRRKKR